MSVGTSSEHVSDLELPGPIKLLNSVSALKWNGSAICMASSELLPIQGMDPQASVGHPGRSWPLKTLLRPAVLLPIVPQRGAGRREMGNLRFPLG